jgi:hypothetical protein
MEAYQAASDEQDATLAKQAQEIEKLLKENGEIAKELADLKASNQKKTND